MIIYLLVLHYISDFLLQSREIAKTKSTSLRSLLNHITKIGMVFVLGLILTVNVFEKNVMLFVLLNSLFHGIIDWYIWRLYKYIKYRQWYDDSLNKKLNRSLAESYGKTFEYWNDKLFYDIIGLDQLLHVITIIFLYEIILK